MHRIALVADVHLGPDLGSKIGSRADALLHAALEAIGAAGADLVVDLGDRVNEVDADTDARNLDRVQDIFARSDAPRVHLLGNHDVQHLGREHNAHALGADMGHESRELGPWHLVFFRPDCRYVPRRGELRMREADLAWLEQDLAATTRPTLVFSHVPLMRVPLEGNPYFAGRPHTRAWHANVDHATDCLIRHPQVVASLHGHTHGLDVTFLDGIAFLTVPSLSESFLAPPEPSGAWAMLELGHELAWTVHGAAPFTCRMPARAPRRAWSASARASRTSSD